MCTNKNNDKIKTNLPTPSFHSSYSFLNPTNCLSVFDHFVMLALKGLIAEKLLSL